MGTSRSSYRAVTALSQASAVLNLVRQQVRDIFKIVRPYLLNIVGTGSRSCWRIEAEGSSRRSELSTEQPRQKISGLGGGGKQMPIYRDMTAAAAAATAAMAQREEPGGSERQFVVPESLDEMNTGRAQLLHPVARVPMDTFDAAQVATWLSRIPIGPTHGQLRQVVTTNNVDGQKLKQLLREDSSGAGLKQIGITDKKQQETAKKKILEGLGRRQGNDLWKGVRATMLEGDARKWLTKVTKDDVKDNEASEDARYQEQLAIAEEFMDKNHMIDPQGNFRKNWDLVQMVLLIYLALAVPYRIFFGQDTEPWEFFFILDLAVDVYFIVDIYMSFKTAYITDDGDMQYSPGMVARNYLNTWFLIDFLGCVPVNYIGYLPGVNQDSQTGQANKMFKLLRLARLLKLLRLARVNRLLQRYEEQFYEFKGSLKVSKIFFLMGFIGHWMSSVFYFVGELEVEDVTPDGQVLVGWVGQHYADAANNTSFGSRYLTSMYFSFMTMTTVGYGDISATTVPEKIYCIFAMMIGGLTFGLIVGILSDINQQADLADKFKNKRIGRVMAFLRSNHVKPALVHKIRNYYTRLYSDRSAIDAAWMLELPEKLRDEVARQLKYIHDPYGNVNYILFNVPFFSRLDSLSLIMICMKLKYVRHVKKVEIDAGDKDNNIITQGDFGSEMYIILPGSAGICRVTTTTDRGVERELGHLYEGEFFGESAILVPHGPKGVKRMRTIAPAWDKIQICELVSLSSEAVTELRSVRKPIDTMIRPFMRQAMASKRALNFTRSVTLPQLKLSDGTFIECCQAPPSTAPQPAFTEAKLVYKRHIEKKDSAKRQQNLNMSGKVAMIQRGGSLIEHTAQNAFEAGAVALVVVNHDNKLFVPSIMSMSMDDVDGADEGKRMALPVISVGSNVVEQLLASDSVTFVSVSEARAAAVAREDACPATPRATATPRASDVGQASKGLLADDAGVDTSQARLYQIERDVATVKDQLATVLQLLQRDRTSGPSS
eukprot:SAG31_NODE_56_length_29726_cov_41.443312_9_plen_999_part_00